MEVRLSRYVNIFFLELQGGGELIREFSGGLRYIKLTQDWRVQKLKFPGSLKQEWFPHTSTYLILGIWQLDYSDSILFLHSIPQYSFKE